MESIYITKKGEREKKIHKNRTAKINIGESPIDIDNGFKKLLKIYSKGSVVNSTRKGHPIICVKTL